MNEKSLEFSGTEATMSVLYPGLTIGYKILILYILYKIKDFSVIMRRKEKVLNRIPETSPHSFSLELRSCQGQSLRHCGILIRVV